ncbi:hypothetical protein B0H15DRAFT_840194 [Mycena belliarum]|uniref:Uncharacterized protein n=1 Tax=Mycena belliarum TaxID=1033014 RepID=A0AAD6XS87_9AGAR|nr:hypothetical protein B0H15DRAFT_840194 [Mycena belliae]
MSPEQPPTSLSTRIAASNPQKQEQSPLFASLHPELRNMVFQHALTEYDDPERPYSKHEYYFRPRMESAGKIDTNLLLTCRRIYLETHLAPVALNEHVFWMYRGPPGHFASDPGNYLEWMTPEQRAAVRRMRFVTQLFWLENRRPTVWPAGLLVPKLAITIRHSDWWGWKNNEPLRIEEPRDGWAGWIGSVPGLQELELELETSDVKREQLEERVRVALGWTFPLAGTHVSLVHDGEEPVKSMWLGTSRMRPRNCINGSAPDEDDDDEESEEEEWSGDEEGSDEEDGWDEYYNESPREEEPEDTVESAGLGRKSSVFNSRRLPAKKSRCR